MDAVLSLVDEKYEIRQCVFTLMLLSPAIGNKVIFYEMEDII